MFDPHRLLNFPGLANARDLGGYPTRNGGTTRWRSLIRADDLVQLTPSGVRAMADYGVETVVDLRWPEEVERAPHPVPRELTHVQYHQISLLVGSETDWQGVRLDCPKDQWKCAVLEHTRRELKRVLETMAAASAGPLVFHCVAGKDRTGVIAALMLTLADATPEAIAYDYAASGEHLREAYLARYTDVPAEEILAAIRCPEEGAYNMLTWLEAQGGIDVYLQSIGLTEPQIARLRARLSP